MLCYPRLGSWSRITALGMLNGGGPSENLRGINLMLTRRAGQTDVGSLSVLQRIAILQPGDDNGSGCV